MEKSLLPEFKPGFFTLTWCTSQKRSEMKRDGQTLSAAGLRAAGQAFFGWWGTKEGGHNLHRAAREPVAASEVQGHQRKGRAGNTPLVLSWGVAGGGGSAMLNFDSTETQMDENVPNRKRWIHLGLVRLVLHHTTLAATHTSSWSGTNNSNPLRPWPPKNQPPRGLAHQTVTLFFVTANLNWKAWARKHFLAILVGCLPG